MAEDFSGLPQVLPNDVPRVREGGFPTDSLLDWEEKTRHITERLVVNLDARTTLIEDNVDLGNEGGTLFARFKEVAEANNGVAKRTTDLEAELKAARGGNYPATTLSAKLSAVQTAAVTAAGVAVAGDITRIETKANNATANGAVFLLARSDPTSGAQASYGWYLTTKQSGVDVGFVGMAAEILPGGASRIVWDANEFQFRNPANNSSVPVLAYDGLLNKFTFNTSVVINGSLVLNGTIVNEKIGNGSISHIEAVSVPYGVGGSVTANTVRVRGNGKVVILVYSDVPPGVIVNGGGQITLYRNGVALRSFYNNVDIAQSGPQALRSTSFMYVDEPGVGNVTYAAFNSQSSPSMGIIVMEIDK